MKVRELGRFIRDQRSSSSLSLRKLSGLTGVSIPYLSQIERGLRRPSADILQAIAKALRVSAETLYVKAGILDARNEVSDPVGEIFRDPTISDRQKRILVDLYQSFRESSSKDRTTRKHATVVYAPSRSVAARKSRKSSPSRGGTANRATAPKRARSKPRAAAAPRKRHARKARTSRA